MIYKIAEKAYNEIPIINSLFFNINNRFSLNFSEAFFKNKAPKEPIIVPIITIKMGKIFI